MPSKSGLTAILRECATLMELRGDNPFRCRAYENGGRTLAGLDGEPERWIEEGSLAGVKGIGKGLIEAIEQYVATGEIELHAELKSEIPSGLVEMLQIPGLGAKKIKHLWEEVGIDTVEKLEASAQAGELAELDGFGKKTEEKILAGIELRRKYAGRHRVDAGKAAADLIRARLDPMKEVERLELAGSLRRARETFKDLDFVVVSPEPEAVMEAFVTISGVETVIAHGPTKSSVMLEGGVPVDLRVVAADEFAPALNYFTGSKEHNTAMRGRAKKQGLRLNEYGLFPEGSEKSLPCPDEKAIYKHLGLAYIEPELREDTGEIEAAEAGETPVLITIGDMRALLHCHSTYSDGKSTLEEMATAACEAGYECFCICDHSQTAAYAGGLKEDDVLRQHEEIDKLNAKTKGFKILKGIESDILGKGELDYPDAFLERFDLVVISVHSRFTMKREAMTQRICRAIEHPASAILGHPTGRLLLERDPYDVDLEAVYETAARHGVAIEINANPYRLDLDWREIRKAKKAGCMFTINPDAHHTSGIAHVAYGVGIARKGGLGPDDVINTKTLAEFEQWLKNRTKARI